MLEFEGREGARMADGVSGQVKKRLDYLSFL